MPRRHPYDDLADRELSAWPGVQWERDESGKHLALRLTYAGESRKVHYPFTPSDKWRGPLNHVQDIRRVLRELGARRRDITNAQCRNGRLTSEASGPIAGASTTGRCPTYEETTHGLDDGQGR